METQKPFFLKQEYQQLIQDLNEEAFFVGGCVRDFLSGGVIGDIDMATPLTPQRVKELLEPKGYRVIETGIDFGTLTILLKNKEPVEITTFRQDVESDGRHAKVAFQASMQSDAARRDLTINALYMDRLGKVYDFFKGQKDLKKGRIRFIGRPVLRIEEDALRILRFLRFWGRFGKMLPDKEGLHACRQKKGLIQNLSYERVQAELFKILSEPKAAPALFQMQKMGLFSVLGIKPDLKGFKRLEKNIRNCFLPPQPLLSFWVLTGGVLPKWPFSKKEQGYFNLLRKSTSYAFQTHHDMRCIVADFGQEIMLDQSLIQKKMFAQKYRVYAKLTVPDFPVVAQDILDFTSCGTGPQIGVFLKKARQIWVSSDFKAQKEVVLKKLLE